MFLERPIWMSLSYMGEPERSHSQYLRPEVKNPLAQDLRLCEPISDFAEAETWNLGTVSRGSITTVTDDITSVESMCCEVFIMSLLSPLPASLALKRTVQLYVWNIQHNAKSLEHNAKTFKTIFSQSLLQNARMSKFVSHGCAEILTFSLHSHSKRNLNF